MAHIQQSQIDPAAALRLKQVLQIVPVAASTWWAGVKSGRFPQPIKLGPRTTAWRACDIFGLIDKAAPAGDSSNER
jgi:predicted DNA-binding transcriptional regulator AlpA